MAGMLRGQRAACRRAGAGYRRKSAGSKRVPKTGCGPADGARWGGVPNGWWYTGLPPLQAVEAGQRR